MTQLDLSLFSNPLKMQKYASNGTSLIDEVGRKIIQLKRGKIPSGIIQNRVNEINIGKTNFSSRCI